MLANKKSFYGDCIVVLEANPNLKNWAEVIKTYELINSKVKK